MLREMALAIRQRELITEGRRVWEFTRKPEEFPMLFLSRVP